MKKKKKAETISFEIGDNVTIICGIYKDISGEIIDIIKHQIGDDVIEVLKIRMGVSTRFINANNVRMKDG